MSRRKRETLSGEDRILWRRVAKTVTPLPGRLHAAEFEPPQIIDDSRDGNAGAGAEKISPADASRPPTRPSRLAGTANHRPLIDRPVREKIARGRIELEARIDLHGMTQHQAHTLLLNFLHQAFQQRIRHVLVITGKGSSHGSDGILHKSVPEWFATPSFRPFVSGYSSAARQHGGNGALYVRIRRHDAEKKS